MNTNDIAHLRSLLLSSMSHANARAAELQAAGKTELATNYGGRAAGLAHALDLLDSATQE